MYLVKERATYTISDDFKLVCGKYVVPQVKEVPSKYWGAVVLYPEITFELDDNK